MIKYKNIELPAYKDYKSVEKQLEHIKSELQECLTAYEKETPERFAEEVCDVLLSAVTLFTKAIPDKNKDEALTYVIFKNKKRGYY